MQSFVREIGEEEEKHRTCTIGDDVHFRESWGLRE